MLTSGIREDESEEREREKKFDVEDKTEFVSFAYKYDNFELSCSVL